jgi:hypothetical protein
MRCFNGRALAQAAIDESVIGNMIKRVGRNGAF